MKYTEQRHNAWRLALALEGAYSPKLAKDLHYMPEQLQTDIEDLQAYIKALEERLGDDDDDE